SIMGDTLPVMAVLWNTTAGEPMAGEDVDIKVWYDDYYNYQYHPVYIENRTLRTNENGYVYYGADISTVPDSRTVYTQISYGDLWVRDSVSKQSLTPTPTPEPVVVPIFDDVSYRAEPNAIVLIKYPLLAADGSPYAEDVNFTVGNRTKNFVNETIAPVDGVITYSLDLAKMPPDETGLYILIDGRTAGYISVGGEGYHSQEVVPFPERAICPPGESVDLGIRAWSHHGQKTVSQDIDVHVTTLTETQVLSLSSAGSLALSAWGDGDMQALFAEIDAMKPETYTTTVQMRNGIGLLNFTMPDDGYIAVVRFVSPNGYEATVLVYGTLDPWLMQRSAPRTVDEYHGDNTWLYSTSEWPSTWDQDAYASVPAGEATITAYVYTYSPTTDEWDNPSGRPVYLYTENGVETKTTDADGACTFIVSTAGKERLDYLLVTDGLSQMDWIYTGYCPLYPISQSSVRPGMIGTNLVAPVDIGMLYPKIERRSATINPVTDGDYDVTVRSYGPDNKPIQEMGYFRFDRISEESIWDLAETELAGTEAAAVVNFSGTETRRVTPATGGYYQAWYGLLDPKSGEIGNYVSATLRNPERFVSYTLEGTVTAETSVPVVFNVSTKDGTPVEGARVVLALGEAAGDGWGSEWYYPPHYNDPRDGNIRLAADWYPDPYTVIATGYTDASGKVTLTFTAPTAGQQALRESLAHASDIPYLVACYHDGELVQEDDGYLAVTTALLPDFVPDVSAPHIVKLERDDSITIADIALLISNIGTADYTFDEANMVLCTAELGPYNESTYFTKGDLAVGETKVVLTTTVSEKASKFGINTSDYRLPLDVNVGIEVNSNRAVEELNYLNNYLAYPVRITAPDLAVKVIAPRYTTPASETAIGIRVTNLGEVGSNAAPLHYTITGERDATIDIPALGANESFMIWENRTFDPGKYTVNVEVNKAGATDYETTFANNRANATVESYANQAVKIELPKDLVLVPGTTYDLPITVTQASELAAYQMDLTFNGTVLAVEDVIPGALSLTAKNITSGSAIFNGADTSGISGNVTVATVRFKVTGTTGDETALNLAADLWDENGLVIPADVASGDVYLLLYGDANSDGKVNQADTLTVLREVVGLESKPDDRTKFLVTDVTRNRVIDVGDAMFIAQYCADLRDGNFRIK
ncbi:MAG: cohesin domain-containing protein, partial [Candidatus Methanomethylophilaceae archaeon]|nr:cohesin domain-containing protein [Candidatus Methanomethylophilaceae archaeon]